MKKSTFFEKTHGQKMTQILLGHFFKTHEKTRFSQLNRFSVHVMAEKTTFFRPLTSSLITLP